VPARLETPGGVVDWAGAVPPRGLFAVPARGGSAADTRRITIGRWLGTLAETLAWDAGRDAAGDSVRMSFG